jgi:hypothetical protein
VGSPTVVDAPSRPVAPPEGRLARRDVAGLRWIAEQYAVRTDVLGHLLSGVAPWSSPRTARVVARWRHAGLVERRRFLVDDAPVVWPTAIGLRRIAVPYHPHPPAVGLLAHLHAVSLVRLGVERSGARRWISERALQRRHPTRDAHLPDGLFRAPGGVDVAVEVELTRKPGPRLRRIVDELTTEHDAVLYVVDSAPVRIGVERAVAALGEQRRVTVVDLARFALPASR